MALSRPATARPLSRAVFIDKDGTLVEDVPHNVDPAHLRIREDAGGALFSLQRAGYRLILVTNQPGISALLERLATFGVVLDGIYHCPHHPSVSDGARACDCRKPLPGLLQRAAQVHGIDLASSWMIGDILDDVEAGRRAGCRTILLDVGSETEWVDGPLRRPDHIAHTLRDAADHILADRRVAPRTHTPAGAQSWTA
jgi:HAD superfamily hydrolase (TIGR01662 family)